MNIKQIFIMSGLSGALLISQTLLAENMPKEDENKLQSDTEKSQCAPYLKQKVRKLHSKQSIDLCELTANKTVLIVNTASHCGFTPQFEQLEAIHKKYQSRGLVVLGFPSDDFFQEEDDEKATADICFVNYGVTFTMLTTNAVRGSDVQPVFKYLGDKSTAPKWNFYKYLVSADGEKVKHFNSRVEPDSVEFINTLESLLAL
jgi:glutathione peroxidase